MYKIKGKNSLVAYVDILGYKELINRFIKSQDLSEAEKILNAYENACKSAIENYKVEFGKQGIEITYRVFSDCICIAVPFSNNQLTNFFDALYVMGSTLTYLQHHLMDDGIFIRGGLSIGYHYSNSNVLFSEGLVKSYCIEQEVAIYPRIVVHEEIIEMFNKPIDRTLPVDIFKKLIIFDSENIPFINLYWTLEQALDYPERYKDVINEQTMIEAAEIVLKEKEMTEISAKDLVNDTGDPYSNLRHLPLHHIELIRNLLEDNKFPEKILEKYTWLLFFLAWYYKGKQTPEFRFFDF